jgi:quinol monooxygenase YgiN
MELTMVTYIATVWAKPGHEESVTRFYQDLEPLLRTAAGFRGRQILRARTGVMVAAVQEMMAAAGRAPGGDHGEGHGPKGTHFILVEQWDSVAERLKFSQSASAARGKDLIPHILPEHSHEFYEDVTPRS